MPSWHPGLLLPLLAAALGGLQLLTSNTANAWETRRATFEWITCGVGAFVAFQIAAGRELRHRTVRAFSIATAAIAAVSVMQNYTSHGRVFWLFESGFTENVFGPFVYHTKLANLAELGIAAALWAALERRGGRLLHLCAAAVLTAAVIASGSRGGTAVIGLEIVVLVGLSGGRERERRRRLRTLVLIGALILPAAGILGWDLLAARLSLEDAGRDTRWAINRASLAAARHFLPFGSGLGTYSSVYPQFARFDAYTRVNQAHNDWLQWLVEGGPALVAVALAMVIGAVRAGFRERWAWGFVFVWLHGLIDYPMQQTPALATLQVAFWGAAMAVGRAGLEPGGGGEVGLDRSDGDRAIRPG